MTTLIKINQKDPGEILNNIKSGEIHLVCVAKNAFTHLNVYAELMLGFNRIDIDAFAELANTKIEVGTLYPKAYLSVLPIGTEQSNELLSGYIEDIFVLNQQYLKSRIIYFSLERDSIDKEMILNIIENKISSIADKDIFVEEIWFEI